MDTKQMNRAADNLRILIASMVEKAKSGHPGGAMGGADFINVLYSKFLVYDPSDPLWIARDRFFLDPGHMSPMLYSVLAMSGFYTVDELRQFRQWGSVTPGHPELDPRRGVENSSGPLGQGHVMAVGCAIAERFLVQRFGETLAHKTYAFISDGGIQEEISQGAGRIAGQLGLHNLIMFYDSNDVQLSTMVHDVDREDVAAKYRAWGWNVLDIDGTDPRAIAGALKVAVEEKKRPTLIIGHTIMARGAVAADGTSFEGKISTHGQPLSKAGADIDKTIRHLGGDPQDPWIIFPEAEALYRERRRELQEIVASRHAEESQWRQANPDSAALLDRYLSGKLPDLDWNAIPLKADMATRNSSAAVLGYLAQHVGNMIVSSADLSNSDKTDGFLKQTHPLTIGDFSGAFLQAGVVELTMACIVNGIVLHQGLCAACGTFFVFSDYMKPAIRMSALQELPAKYIFSHDAFRVGEDGPTHQPVEQEAQIRLLEQMNNLSGNMAALVLRPADSAECVQCYKLAMENNDSPSILILSRQDIKDVPCPAETVAAGVPRGAYVVADEPDAQITLLANGSEVSLLSDVQQQLKAEGIPARLVSMPSVGLFMRQDPAYREQVLPSATPVYALSAGLPAALMPALQGHRYQAKGLQRFGASAPYKVLDREFGFTTDNIVAQIKLFLQELSLS